MAGKIFNERGQTLAATPLLVLVLGVLLSGAALVIMIVQKKSDIEHYCQSQVISMQTRLTRAMNELEGLNPLARQLRIERAAADAKVAATVMLPPAHAAARAWQAHVMLRQLKLRAKQELILLKNKIDLVRLQIELRSGLASRQAHITSFPTLTLVVRTTPQSSLSPDRLPAFTFERRHYVRVNWTHDASQTIPEWISNWIRFDSTMTGFCAASPIQSRSKGLSQWMPTLREDKP